MTKPTAMLWVFDPHHNKVYLEDEKGEHPAGYPTFGTMAVHVDHPERQEGYAFSIEGGWRVTDRHGKKIDDPYVTRRVVSALNHENHTHLPSILPHGDPLKHHADAQPLTMYHVAPRESRSSILQHGLDFTRGGGAGDHPEGNYLFGDEQSCHEYAATQYTYHGIPYDIWQVRADGLPLEGDPYLESTPEASAITQSRIEPERLQLMGPDEWGWENTPTSVYPETVRRPGR